MVTRSGPPEVLTVTSSTTTYTGGGPPARATAPSPIATTAAIRNRVMVNPPVGDHRVRWSVSRAHGHIAAPAATAPYPGRLLKQNCLSVIGSWKTLFKKAGIRCGRE